MTIYEVINILLVYRNRHDGSFYRFDFRPFVRRGNYGCPYNYVKHNQRDATAIAEIAEQQIACNQQYNDRWEQSIGCK